MARRYANVVDDKAALKDAFEKSIKVHGHVEIVTVLDHVSRTGNLRYISAFIPLLTPKGEPYMHCIAREKRLGGCGMDMGFALAYDMFMSIYGGDMDNHPYQKFLHHSWM